MFAPSRQSDLAFQNWWARFERLGASPSAAIALMRMNSQIDITDIVPTIRVPTLVIHRTDDVTINVEGGRFRAKHIPGARYAELKGTDHIPCVGENAEEIADLIEEFLTGPDSDVSAGVPDASFTEIAGVDRALQLGWARCWRDLPDGTYAAARRADRFRGPRDRSAASACSPPSMVRLGHPARRRSAKPRADLGSRFESSPYR